MKVDPVEQRSGDLFAVTPLLIRLAGAAELVVSPAAGTRIHGRDQNEFGRKGTTAVGAGDGDAPGFQRLAQDLKHIALEFRQFIQKQHSVVCPADLARHRILAAADQPHVAGGMMRSDERAAVDQRLARLQQPEDAVNTAGFKCLLKRHRRENTGQTA